MARFDLKPPRAHYCAVSRSASKLFLSNQSNCWKIVLLKKGFVFFDRKLVLNLDHYCIWVFNTIGYRNCERRELPVSPFRLSPLTDLSRFGAGRPVLPALAVVSLPLLSASFQSCLYATKTSLFS